MSQHHRAHAEAIGVVYDWDLVTGELTIPVVEPNENVVTSDPAAVVKPVTTVYIRPPTKLTCPSGRHWSFYRDKPIEPIESRVYELWLTGIGRREMAKQLKVAETTIRARLFRARAKMGEFDGSACPKD